MTVRSVTIQAIELLIVTLNRYFDIAHLSADRYRVFSTMGVTYSICRTLILLHKNTSYRSKMFHTA